MGLRAVRRGGSDRVLDRTKPPKQKTPQKEREKEKRKKRKKGALEAERERGQRSL